MERLCNICGVIRTETPDMCDYCHASINSLEYIKRLLYNVEDSKAGTAMASMIEEMSLVKRHHVNGRPESIGLIKGDHGERIPGLLHAPYLCRYTEKYAYPGGLIRFMSDLVDYHDTSVKKDRDGFVRAMVMYLLHHGILEYQYVDPNGDGKTFKRLSGIQPGWARSLSRMNSKGVSFSPEDILFISSDGDSCSGISANLISGIISLTRGA